MENQTLIMSSKYSSVTSLMLAAISGREDMVTTLLKTKDSSHHVLDSDGRTALMLACTQGHSGVVHILTSHNPMEAKNMCDNNGMTAAMIACDSGHYKCAAIIGTVICSALDVTDIEGQTLAMRAVLAGQHEVVLSLLREGRSKVTDRNAANNTIVMIAIARGDSVLVRALVAEYGADVTARDECGRTGFMQCIETNITANVLVMLSLGVMYPGTRDNRGRTGTMIASAKGNTTVLRSIFAYQKRWRPRDQESIRDVDNRSWNALIFAVHNKQDDMVRCLVNEYGADVEVLTVSNFTPLLMAASAGSTDTIRVLVNECNADIHTHLYRQWSALVLAADGGHTECVVALIRECGCCPNEKDSTGWVPIMFSVFRNHVSTVRALGASGCDVNTQNDLGLTALMMAAELGNIENVRFLCAECSADTEILAKNSRSALMLSAELGMTDIAVALVVEFGANVDLKNKLGYTALCFAAKAKHYETVRALVIVCHAKTHVQCRNYGGFSGMLYTPSTFAAEYGDLDSLRVLIEATDSDVNFKSPGGISILSTAAAVGQTAVVQYLIENGANVHSVDEEFNTALMVSSMNGHNSTAYVLASNTRGSVDVKNLHGNTALALACIERNYNIMAFLVTEFNADPNIYLNSFGATPLAYTIANGSLIGTLLLLDVCKVDVSILDQQYKNPLMIASLHSRVSIIPVLVIEQGINIDTSNESGFTPLIYAVMYGTEETVQMLLDLGANIELHDAWGNSAVTHAIERKRSHLIRMMIEAHMINPLSIVQTFSLCLCEYAKMKNSSSFEVNAGSMPGDIVVMILKYYLQSIVNTSTFSTTRADNIPPLQKRPMNITKMEAEKHDAEIASDIDELLNRYV